MTQLNTLQSRKMKLRIAACHWIAKHVLVELIGSCPKHSKKNNKNMGMKKLKLATLLIITTHISQ